MDSHQEKQTVRKDIEIETKLIGDEAVTAQPVSFELDRELLDSVLDIPAKDIDLVRDGPGVATQVRHQKLLIGPLVGVLGLDNHLAPSHPRACPLG